jgi:predicted phage terminase large subunit-like protein
MSFSSITGFGADIIVVDDAHDIENVESNVIREAALRVWDEVLPTRLNDPKIGMFIVIMQRSHERDLIGHILAKEFNGIHVCLPAEFEGGHPYVFLNPKWPVPRKTDSSKGADGGPKIGDPWHDFRQEGESLWKSRFPKEVLKRWAFSMTSHAAAGQLQQRPTAREGGLFKREWFTNPVKFAPEGLQRVRSWDLASASDPKADPDYSVGLLMGLDPRTQLLYLLDVIRGRWSPAEVENKIKATARWDGEETRIRIPQDPGQAGKFQAAYLAGQLRGYSVSSEREEGNKERRADPFAAQCEHGFVKLVAGDWNKSFIDELCSLVGLNPRRSVQPLPSTFFQPSFSLRRLRTTPARKPRTECGCQPVAFIIASIVAPVGDCSNAMTRDCFEPRSALLGSGSLRRDDFVVGTAAGADAVGRFFADFDIEILRSASRRRAAPPKPHLGDRAGGAGSHGALGARN